MAMKKKKAILVIVGGLFLLAIVAVIAVSYTHLDVYKRQI